MDGDAILIDTNGRRITDAALRRGLRLNIVAGLLGVAWYIGTQGMPLTMFLEALGSNGVQMGLAAMAIQSAFVMQLPGALLADRLERRKPLWAAFIIASRLLWFLPLAFLALFAERPGAVAQAMIWLCAVQAIVNQSVSALWSSWMADLVPQRMIGRFWGSRQTYTTVSNLVATAAAGWVLDAFPPPSAAGGSWTGFSLLFAVSAVLGAVDIVIHLGVPEPRVRERPAPAARVLDRVLEPLRDADFRRLTLSMGSFAFACGLVSLGFVYLKRDFHVHYSHLSAIVIASTLGIIVSSMIWGYVLDRVGGRAFGAIMLLLTPAPSLVWYVVRDARLDFTSFCAGIPLLGPALGALFRALPAGWSAWIASVPLPQPVWLLIFSSFLVGSFVGGIGLAQMNLMSVLTARGPRTVSMAVNASVVGLLGSAGALVAGKVMDFCAVHPVPLTLPTGVPVSFYHVLHVGFMAVIWFVSLPLLLSITRRKGEPEMSGALNQVFALNPFRIVTNVYLMGAAVGSRTRASAVRSLAGRGSIIAVRDLVQLLDDPAADVREETALALGAIGTPEAVSALVARMEDPRSGLAPQCARALRTARAPSSAEALLRGLDAADRETRCECARALGALGERRAVAPLLEILAAPGDDKLTCAAAEALALLDDLRAVPALTARLAAGGPPVLRRTLAVAVADLLGERDEFYKSLTRERQVRGSEAGDWLADLRRDLLRAARGHRAAAATALAGEVERLRALFEEERPEGCAALLAQVAAGLAGLRPAGRRPRLAVAAAFLAAYGEPREGRDDLDILLGVFVLAAMARAE